MISLGDVYHVVSATVPLYIAMMLAYATVRWWKMFSAEQCSGINKFVAKLSIPLLSFQIVSENNPYEMNGRLILADLLQKGLALVGLGLFARVTSKGSLAFVITALSVSILPNTLILGIPLLQAMYGRNAAQLLAQIVALQSLIWYNLLLFLYEFNAAKCSVTPESSPESEAKEELEQQANATAAEETTRKRKRSTMLILLTVATKLVGNPNTHATVIGLVWACIKFRWNVRLPAVMDDSITILADGGLGMAMFSLGLFMASRTSIIACGTRMAILSMALKFLGGPLLMAAASLAVGLRGTNFRVAIVQAALPQGIVPFVFAKEYNVHPEILSTGVIFGLLIALPIALLYFFLLAL